MARYLVIANQTLGGAELEQAIRERVDSGPSEFHVVVPMVSPTYEAPTWMPADPSFGVPVAPVEVAAEADAIEEARRRSQHRLDRMVDKIRDLGGQVDGAVADGDPVDTARDAVERQEFDEVILSTLPAGISRWVKMDLPSRLTRAVDIPVVTVEAT